MQLIDRAMAAAERVARACIPDLVDRELYIVQPAKMNLHGFYSPGLDRILQPLLEAQNEWHGPGVAIVVNARLIISEAYDEDDLIRRLTGVVLHELTHHFDRPEHVETEPPPRLESWVEEVNRHDAQDTSCGGFTLSFLSHGESFCRAISHIWHRARTGGGMVLGVDKLVYGSLYPGLEYCPHPCECVEALEEELESRRAERLRDILATEPPIAYRDLWLRAYARMPLPAELAAQLQEIESGPNKKSASCLESLPTRDRNR